MFKDSEDTLKVWPDRHFELVYKITLTQRTLVIDTSINNTGAEKPLDFTYCLHTYFKVIAT